MSFQRRILHHGPDPAGAPQLLSLTALRSCWFELHRQGGCGAGELILADDFEQRNRIHVGDWISFEAEAGLRWYLGRVEERAAEVPAQIRYRLEGMAMELNQVFPGGFGNSNDGGKPHRYGATDLFAADPDRAQETADLAGTADSVVRLLMTQYVTRWGHIHYDSALVEPPALTSPVVSLKLRGEESVRSLMKDLALRAQSASWGVDASGTFFFLKPRNDLLVTYREQRDLVALTESRDLEFLFNRLLLTGDYVYDNPLGTNDVARRAYRWRGNYFEPGSRTQHGDRRLKIWLPWIRTQADSLAFAREFFRAYAQPATRYLIETLPQSFLPFPWLGRISLENVAGEELVRSRIETIRVLFDHAPRFRLELGPEDPRALWPEPPQDERWEIPHQRISAGGPVSEPPPLPSSGGGGGGSQGGPTSDDILLSSDDEESSASEDPSDDLSSGSSAGSSPDDPSDNSGGDTLTSLRLSSSGFTIDNSGGFPSLTVHSDTASSADSSDDSSSDDLASLPLTSFVWSPTFPSEEPISSPDSSSMEESSSDDNSSGEWSFIPTFPAE